jgi:hypothetical protein
MTRRLLGIWLVAVGACASDTVPGPKEDDSTVVAPYGALEPRLMALRAFNGERDAVTLSMTVSTIEGAPIRSEFVASAGRAILTIDERADGGAVRVDTLSALSLVRYVPSRWVGNVEVEEDHFEAVGADVHAAPGDVFLLVDPRCLSGPCSRVF